MGGISNDSAGLDWGVLFIGTLIYSFLRAWAKSPVAALFFRTSIPPVARARSCAECLLGTEDRDITSRSSVPLRRPAASLALRTHVCYNAHE